MKIIFRKKWLKKRSELLLITEVKRLIDYIFVISEKSPRKYRYSFLTKIHNLLFDIIELLYEANSIKLGNEERKEKQREAKVKLEIVDYLCDLGTREKCYLFSQYENISKYICECMKLLNGWIESDTKRILNSKI